jgi:hypothetical protein
LGELGILSEVNLSSIEPILICYLKMQFEDEQYMGTLLVRDVEVCRKIHDLLKSHIDKPIQEIGDLELVLP